MTNTQETDDFDIVLQDPAAFFRLPQAIIDDPALCFAEKRALLAEWHLDLVDRSTALAEGMVPETPASVDRDVMMQDRVAAALAALDAAGDNDAEIGSLAKNRVWCRITRAA